MLTRPCSWRRAPSPWLHYEQATLTALWVGWHACPVISQIRSLRMKQCEPVRLLSASGQTARPDGLRPLHGVPGAGLSFPGPAGYFQITGEKQELSPRVLSDS